MPDRGCVQVVMWVALPAMIRAGSTTPVMTVLLLSFLLEYLPKIYHSVSFLRRTQDQSGHIFGTIWWGIVLNLMAYFVAAHVRPLLTSCPSMIGSPQASIGRRTDQSALYVFAGGGRMLVLARRAKGHQVPQGAVLAVWAAGVRVRSAGVRRPALLRWRGVVRRRR
jgi:hypothetical protein